MVVLPQFSDHFRRQMPIPTRARRRVGSPRHETLCNYRVREPWTGQANDAHIHTTLTRAHSRPAVVVTAIKTREPVPDAQKLARRRSPAAS